MTNLRITRIVFLLCTTLLPIASGAVTSSSDPIALVGGTIYVSPTEEPIRDGILIIEDGKIAAVGTKKLVALPQNVKTIDCSGLTVTADFWNSHVHFFERKWANVANIPAPELSRQLQAMFTQYGFISVFDTGSLWENTRRLRDRIESGEVFGPRIRSTGAALVAPGAIPSESILGILGFVKFPAPEIVNSEDAQSATRKLLDDGVDGIKVYLRKPPQPNPPFPESAIPAAITVAHESRKPVFVHPETGSDLLTALQYDVDVILHTTPRSRPWNEAILKAMKKKKIALTPTLTLWKSAMRHDRISTQEEITKTAVAQLRAWNELEGTILFGSDLGAIEYDPSQEYALMSEAGMSFRQILASLTTIPAERFGDSKQMGRIARGFQADLVVFKGDPSQNIQSLASVQNTLRSGNVIYHAIAPLPSEKG